MAQSLGDASGEALSTGSVAGLAWRKSARSIANGQCVEAAALPDGRLAVRDSLDKSGPMAIFAGNAWRVLVKQIKDGVF